MQTIYDYPPTPRGDTVDALQITLTWDDTGSPVSLLSSVIRCHFRECSPDGPVVYRADLTTGITIVDAANGVFRVDEFIANFPKAGTYYYDTEVVTNEGYKTTPVTGTLDLTADVTR